MKYYRQYAFKLFSLLLLSAGFLFAQQNHDGDLDLTFGSGGTVLSQLIGNSSEYITKVVIQNDGKIIAIGNGREDYPSDNFYNFIMRYNSDGTLDNSFSSDGIIQSEPSLISITLNDAIIDVNGKILVLGNGGSGSWKLFRYNNDGSLDTSFDNDGILEIFPPSSVVVSGGTPLSLALNANGKIVIAGNVLNLNDNGNQDTIILQLNTDGSFDNTFGTGGFSTMDFSGSYDYANDVAIQADGKIVVVGQGATGKVQIVRYNSNGTLDASFGANGKLAVENGIFANGANVAIQADGKIVIGGQGSIGDYSKLGIIRLNIDGTLDSTFDGDGKVTISLGAQYDYVENSHTMALQADGKILLAGRSDLDYSKMYIVRLLSNGSADTGFGITGISSISFNEGLHQPAALALQPDGSIILAGTASPMAVIARFTGSSGPVSTGSTYLLTVNFDPAMGFASKLPDLGTYLEGSIVSVSAVPKPGYFFSGWSGDANGSNNPLTVTMDGNKNITANYSLNAYTLTVTSANGTVAKNPDQANYNHGTQVQLTATPNAGYTFTGWSGDANGSNNPLTVTMDGNKNITANYSLNAYTLTVTSANGTVAKNPDQANYNHGTQVQLTATPNVGYTFTGWSGDVSGNTNPITITLSGNKTITANFKLVSPIGFIGLPDTVVAGRTFQFQVVLGNAITGASSTAFVTLSAPGLGPTAYLSSSAIQGVAYFRDLYFQSAGTYTISAQVQGFNTLISKPIVVIEKLSYIAFNSSPAFEVSDRPFSTAPVVKFLGASGSSVKVKNPIVQLSVSPAPGTTGAPTLVGETTVSVIGEVSTITYANMKVIAPQGTYILKAKLIGYAITPIIGNYNNQLEASTRFNIYPTATLVNSASATERITYSASNFTLSFDYSPQMINDPVITGAIRSDAVQALTMTNYNFMFSSSNNQVIAQGPATINGAGNYMLQAQILDSRLRVTLSSSKTSSSVLVRLKIWDRSARDSVIFDSQPGDSAFAPLTTIVETGSITPVQIAGSGTYNSPAGAYAANKGYTGFGALQVEVKEEKIDKQSGVTYSPKGKIEFDLRPAKAASNQIMKFAAENFDLIFQVAGMRLVRGTGKLNDKGNYGVIFCVYDAKVTGAKKDKVHLKIWNKDAGNAVVYDNQPGDPDFAIPTVMLASGNFSNPNGSINKDADGLDIISTEYALLNNYPNPFNPTTTIKLSIPEAGNYSLKVYNILGEQVAELVNDHLEQGNYRFNFDASSLSSGIYFYNFRGNNINMTKKMNLVK